MNTAVLAIGVLITVILGYNYLQNIFDSNDISSKWIHPKFGKDIPPTENERKTLVINFDGFRWDYIYRIRRMLLDKSEIWKLIKQGAHAPGGITSEFTTTTFPNLYSVVTGMHPDKHGIVANSFYDSDLRRQCYLKKDDGDGIYHGTPIWRSLMYPNDLQEQPLPVAACSMWVACQCTKFPEGFFVKNNISVDWEPRIDKVIEWLSIKSMKLVTMYYHEPDNTGHNEGPGSEKIDEMLKQVDGLIGGLVKRLKKERLFNNLNFIIMSNQGIMDLAEKDKLVLPTEKDLPKEIFNRVRTMEAGMWLVEPESQGASAETIQYFNQFPRLRVIKKEYLPDSWHYKTSPRVSKLMIVPDPGYVLPRWEKQFDFKGDHGYDNRLTDMRPTFIARGPAFIRGSIVPPEIGTVDIYLLLSIILGQKPAEGIDATDLYFDDFVRQRFLKNWRNQFDSMQEESGTENLAK